MLEKPDLQEENIIACVQEIYGLRIAQNIFFPLGADRNTAVYRIITEHGTPYFLKLRGGDFDDTEIDPIALAYYRYGRIIQDIAVYCEQLLLTTAGGEDRERSLHHLTSNFLPNNRIEIAYNADKSS